MKCSKAAFTLVACGALFCQQASAVAFAEIRFTHLTTGVIVAGTPVVTSSVDLNSVAATFSSTSSTDAPGLGVSIPVPSLRDGLRHYFDLSYTYTVSDDGLPGRFMDPCTPLHLAICFFSQGPELAGVALYMGYIDERIPQPPSFDSTYDVLQFRTNADSTADHITQSGVAHSTLFNSQPSSGEPFLPLYGAQAFLYANTVTAAAVPEPETYALLLAGLAGIGAFARRRRR